MKRENINTLGDLKKSGYQPKTIQQELAHNLKTRLQKGLPSFEGLIGYENTVIPDVERAILSGHNMNLLGLRGQAKTRLARQLTALLDEWIPVVEGSEINDDPLDPISREAKELIAEKGDKSPINWLHQSDRFYEKLASSGINYFSRNILHQERAANCLVDNRLPVRNKGYDAAKNRKRHN